jgi:hypothetical protein
MRLFTFVFGSRLALFFILGVMVFFLTVGLSCSSRSFESVI